MVATLFGHGGDYLTLRFGCLASLRSYMVVHDTPYMVASLMLYMVVTHLTLRFGCS